MEKTEERMNVYKVVGPSGTEVLLRPMKVSYEDMALQIVGKRAGDNHALLQKMMLDEILKILIVAINGERPDVAKAEKLDSLLEYTDIMFLRRCVQKMMGGDEGEQKPLVLELASYSGGK